MSATTATPSRSAKKASSTGRMKDGRRRSPFSMVTMFLLAVLWTLPTIGLLVTSFRSRDDALSSGWWDAIINPFGTSWTFGNYAAVFDQANMGNALINGLAVSIPATRLPWIRSMP